MFGPCLSDSRGKIVEELAHKNNLVSLNTGMGTHLAPNGSSSAIDVALASPNKALKSTWKVLDQNLGSDHFVIQIVINEPAFREEIRLPSINMKKVNWNSFQLRCLRTLHQELPSEDLEENTNYVTASILQDAKLSSPAPKVYLERTPAPFWNENCRLAIKERNRKRNIFRRNITEESFENYKRAKGRAQRVVKNAKKECWQSFCSRLNRNTDLGTLWRTIKSMNSQHPDSSHCFGIRNSSGQSRQSRDSCRHFCSSQQQFKLVPEFRTNQKFLYLNARNLSA